MLGASDDDHSDREEVTTNFSFPDLKRVKKMSDMSDEELLVILSNGIARLPACGLACDCLVILSDVNVRQCVAQYLLQFVRKSKATRTLSFKSGTSMQLLPGLGADNCGFAYLTMQLIMALSTHALERNGSRRPIGGGGGHGWRRPG